LISVKYHSKKSIKNSNNSFQIKGILTLTKVWNWQYISNRQT